MLTNVTSFKSWYNFQGTTADEGLIALLINSVSNDIMNYLDRDNFLKHTLTDYYDGTGGAKLMLRQWPVLSISSLYIDGNLQSPAAPPSPGYFLDPWSGYLPGKMQSLNVTGACFPIGLKNVNCIYSTGYSISNEAQTVTLQKATANQTYGLWMQDDGVTYANGTALTPTTSVSPSSGQYNVVNGSYTFNSADNNAGVLISYSYIPYPIVQACNMLIAEQYAYRQRIGQKSHSVMGNTTLTFDNSIRTQAITDKLNPYKRMQIW